MATWTTTTVNATYPKVLSIAQSKNTGQYMLSIVTDAADTTDARGRVFKSNDYGSTWTLLEDLFANNGTDTSHLNYATLASSPQAYSVAVLYACAISDDGKYQSFGQKAHPNNGVWYSTNYGNTTGSTDEKWKYIVFDSNVRTNPTTPNGAFPGGVQQMMYSPGPYPVFFSDYVYFRAFSHLAGLTPATGSISEFGNAIGTYFTSTVPALYDNDFTTISRRVVYYISGGNLYKNIDGGSGVNINPTNWPVSNAEGGGVAVSTLGTIVVASRYANSTGGLWLSTDGGTNWTQKLVNYDVNAVDMSNDGKYIIAGPRDPTSGVGRFYVSQDFGANWTYQDLSFTGILHKLHITNNGKRAVGAGMKSGYGYFQPTTTGYITYIGPLSAAEQRAAGKTVAELIALSYSINDIVGAGYSTNELIAAGIVPDWNIDNSANHFIQSYVKDFIDISGSLLLRNNANLYVKGNATVNGKLLMNNVVMQTDLSFNKRIFVGSDISMNGNVTIVSDVSLNGSVLGCTFNVNSIPTSAFSGTVTAPSADYTKASVIYPQKFQANADVSMNGSTVQATNMTVNGNIVFNDGTKMNTYDNNRIPIFDASYSSAYICSDIPSTYITEDGATVPGPGLISSDDGKYLLSLYGLPSQNNPYYITGNSGLAGLFLSTNYGTNFTLVTLPSVPAYTNGSANAPANDLTKVNYLVNAISSTGKCMICALSGQGNTRDTWKDSVIALSTNYGVSWTTKFTWDFLKQSSFLGSFDAIVNALTINDDASIVIANISIIHSQGSINSGTYISTNSMTSFTKIALPSPSNNRIHLISNNRILLSSGAPERIFVYDLSGTQIYDNGAPPHSYMIYCTTRSGNITIQTNSWSPSNSTVPTCDITKYDGTTFTKTNVTANNNTTLPGIYTTPYTTINQNYKALSAMVSPSGKYIIIGYSPDYASLTIHPDIFTRNVFYSNNYGIDPVGGIDYKFTSIPALYPLASNPSKSSLMTDSGFLFVQYTKASGNKIVRLDFNKFKASTFTGLTIKNTLTAGSYAVSSDYRIKTDVSKLDNMFTVDNLRPVKYLQTLTNKQQYGFIAHELQQYYPDLVFGEKDGTDLQRVNYTGLIAILINEITQLKRELAELESKCRPAVSL